MKIKSAPGKAALTRPDRRRKNEKYACTMVSRGEKVSQLFTPLAEDRIGRCASHSKFLRVSAILAQPIARREVGAFQCRIQPTNGKPMTRNRSKAVNLHRCCARFPSWS